MDGHQKVGPCISLPHLSPSCWELDPSTLCETTSECDPQSRPRPNLREPLHPIALCPCPLCGLRSSRLCRHGEAIWSSQASQPSQASSLSARWARGAEPQQMLCWAERPPISQEVPSTRSPLGEVRARLGQEEAAGRLTAVKSAGWPQERAAPLLGCGERGNGSGCTAPPGREDCSPSSPPVYEQHQFQALAGRKPLPTGSLPK